jgi:DNA-binding IclR family transcriptional regulator
MPFWLTRDGPYRKDLVVRAQPVITRLARELQEWVIVATMNMGKRFIICRAEVNRPLITNTDYFFLEDAYSASTGRVLLAGLVPDELESYISSYGLPTDWDGVQTKGELYEKLEKIRNQGFATNTLADEVVQIAFPIQADLRVPAALGLAMPLSRFQGDNRTRVLMTMKAAAEEISGRPASSEPASGTTDEKELH